MSSPVDLRSDTVTMPTPQMRRAMAEAEVGDDWYGDDPTVNRLEARAAEVMGTEAALYLPTGTLANQTALHVLTRSGRLVVCADGAHVGTTEMATSAVLSGIAYVRVPAPGGRMDPQAVAEVLRPDPFGVDIVDLLAVENTFGIGGGRVVPVEDVRALRKEAQEAGVPVYMDGARLFNAAVASATPVGEFAAEVDALMFCLSKGLGAPIGSVLCGSASFIKEARTVKILLGAGWRQAGVVAAAGLVALEEGPKRLHEDHTNARRLAVGIAEATPGVTDPGEVETNMVFLDTAAVGAGPWEMLDRLEHAGVRANVLGGRIRLVTHRDVSAKDVETAIEAWVRAAGEAKEERG